MVRDTVVVKSVLAFLLQLACCISHAPLLHSFSNAWHSPAAHTGPLGRCFATVRTSGTAVRAVLYHYQAGRRVGVLLWVWCAPGPRVCSTHGCTFDRAQDA